MILPKDLTSYCRKRVLMRVIPCAILASAFTAVLVLWGNILFSTNIIGTDVIEFKISCYIIFMLIPFVITGVPLKLIDTTYYGTVKEVDIKTSLDNFRPTRPTGDFTYFKNTIYLTIERPNCKIIRRKVYSGRAKLQQNLDTYHEGDSVFHLYGTNTVAVLPKSSNTSVHCVVCGSSNNIKYDKCHDCGHSLIISI